MRATVKRAHMSAWGQERLFLERNQLVRKWVCLVLMGTKLPRRETQAQLTKEKAARATPASIYLFPRELGQGMVPLRV
jgi:hypothetical protein